MTDITSLNRAQRRSLGMRGPTYTHSLTDGRPRFVRRHVVEALAPMLDGEALTRRQRRVAARVQRAAVRKGLLSG